MRYAGLLAVFLATAAAAEDCDSTQLAMNTCAAASLRKADAALNAVYAKVLAGVTTDSQRRLREAQRAWVGFRDKQCTFISNGDDGGSVAPMIAARCMEEETRLRTTALKRLLSCAEGDLSCPQ